MFHSRKLKDELQSLKHEVTRALGAKSDNFVGASRSTANDIAEQIETALSGLEQTLSHDEKLIERMISERPIATTASAFALGVVAGFMLRRN